MSGAFLAAAFLPTGFLTEEVVADQPTERDGHWIRRAAERQRYIYQRTERIRRSAPPEVAEVIERVVEKYEESPAPEITEAVGLLRRELRSEDASQGYVDLLLLELALLDARRKADDEDAEMAAIVMLLH
jgi:hypothetical protein